jgi:hypothetical protein
MISQTCCQQSNFGPDSPTSNGGVSLLSFGALDPFATEIVYIIGTIDVNLINNTFINNDYSVVGDTSVSVYTVHFLFRCGVLVSYSLTRQYFGSFYVPWLTSTALAS